MARVTIDEVAKILPPETDISGDALIVAIDAASITVDALESTLSDAQLKMIERYLSAHFSAVTENTLSISAEKDPCSNGSINYGWQLGEGLMGTRFGQMANTMSLGALAELSKPQAQIFSIGSI